jgi:hypothetical protein
LESNTTEMGKVAFGKERRKAATAGLKHTCPASL